MLPLNRLSLVAAIGVATAFAAPGVAAASQLVLGPDALRELVASTLFTEHGRWNLLQGTCFAYLERPVVSLSRARVVINARLTSRLGIEAGGACVGVDLASDVVVSGIVRGSGSELSLQDIHVDRVGNDSSSQTLELLREAVSDSVPRAARIDLMALIRPTAIPGLSKPARITRLAITDVTTNRTSVSVRFELDVAIP